jgi:hypothetical protein
MIIPSEVLDMEDGQQKFNQILLLAKDAGIITVAQGIQIWQRGRKQPYWSDHVRNLLKLIEDTEADRLGGWKVKAAEYGVRSLDAWALYYWINQGILGGGQLKKKVNDIEPAARELERLGLIAINRTSGGTIRTVTLLKSKGDPLCQQCQQ